MYQNSNDKRRQLNMVGHSVYINRRGNYTPILKLSGTSEYY